MTLATQLESLGPAAARTRSRFQITSVDKPDGHRGPTMLLLRHAATGEDGYGALLRDEWAGSPVSAGDMIHLLGARFGAPPLGVAPPGVQRWCELGRGTGGLLILHPDALISPTAIATSLRCARRAVLADRVADFDRGAPLPAAPPPKSRVDGGAAPIGSAALNGTLQHELLQWAMAASARGTPPDAAAMSARASTLIASHTLDLFESDDTEDRMATRLTAAIPGLLSWLHTYAAPGAPGGPLLHPGGGVAAGRQRCVAVSLVDIEESVWSPALGLKGAVDATLMVTSVDGYGRRVRDGESVVPLEIKTGKRALVDHTAQLMLYSAMLHERHGGGAAIGSSYGGGGGAGCPGPGPGWLLYTREGATLNVDAPAAPMGHLMQRRNELAAALGAPQLPSSVQGRVRSPGSEAADEGDDTPPRLPPLPPVVRDDFACRWCYQSAACTAYHAAVEAGDAVSFGVADVFQATAGHLTAAHGAWLAKWDRLVELESLAGSHRRALAWAIPSISRERSGDGLGRLVMASLTPVSDGGLGVVAVLVRPVESLGAPLGATAPLPDTGRPSPGDHVLLSTECGHVNLARGVVTTRTAGAITVALKRPPRLPRSVHATGAASAVRWRLDPDDVFAMTGKLRGNLMRVLSPGAGHLRSLVIDAASPAFDTDASVGDTSEWTSGLNPGQEAAVRLACASKDYCIIQGTPGSGKSTALVALVRTLAGRGATVLLSAYTNAALDALLLSLLAAGVDLLRIGRGSADDAAVHSGVRDACLGGSRWPASTTAELAAAASGARVVGATCYGAAHPLVSRRSSPFDVCIIDEAGQATMPACLGPISAARRFILVGDPQQLPPLVTSRAAATAGLADSLLASLARSHPAAVAALTVQHRMNDDVMSLSNVLVYGGALQCASPHQAASMYTLPRLLPPSTPAWVVDAWRPDRRVMFWDTDGLDARGGAETPSGGDTVSNAGEAALAARLVAAALAVGASPGDVAVYTPYRAQVAAIDGALAAAGVAVGGGGIEVLTVDKCQGRDRSVVIVSFVRSNAAAAAGRLLGDARRVNVLLTRARHKLLLLGSRSTLSSVPVLAALLAHCDGRGWLVALPPDALVPGH